MRTSLVKWLPSLAVTTLVVLAAGAHTGPPRLPIPSIEVTATRLSRPMAAEAAGVCTRTALEYRGSAAVLFPASDVTVTQVITPSATIESSRFALPPTTDAVTYTVRRYAEAAGGGSIGGISFPLDYRGGGATLTAELECEVAYGRPIVTESLPGVADPFVGPDGGSLEIQVSNLSGGPAGIVQADLEPNAPHAFAQLPGQSVPVELAHAMRLSECSPDEPFGPLNALQQVVHGLQPVGLPGVTELAQRFTVPTTGTALWFEIPTVPSGLPGGASPVTVELRPITETANPLPPAAFGVTITAGGLDLGDDLLAAPVWRAAGSLLPALLVPGQEYLFVLRFAADQFTPVLDLSGRDVLAGPLHSRTDSSSPWVPIPGANLGLRIIGVAGTIPEPSCDFMVHSQATLTASLTLGGGSTLTALLQRVFEPTPTAPWSSGFIAMSSGRRANSVTANLYLGSGPAAAGEIAVALARSLPPPTRTSEPDLAWTDFAFGRQMVTEAVTATAQTVSGTAFSIVVTPSVSEGVPTSATFTALYRSGGPTLTPFPITNIPDLLVRTPSGWEVAPGADPRLGLLLCGSTDPSSNALRVLQQVHRPDEVGGATATALIQRFTVPTDGYVQSVEMALRKVSESAGVNSTPPQVTLYTAGPISGTAFPIGITLTAADMGVPTLPGAGEALWASTGSFPSPPLLHAGQQYLLELRFPEPGTFMPHLSHAPVDPAWALAVSGVTFNPTLISGTVCFRLIGWPAASPVGVPPTTIRADGLKLEAYPNPSGAALSLRWHGGRGVTQLEIIDVRGRRVRRITAGDARAGSYIWDGRDSAGNLVPPGVYFASARDGSGSAPSRRLIRIR